MSEHNDAIEAAKGQIAGLINQAERDNLKLAANWLRTALMEVDGLRCAEEQPDEAEGEYRTLAETCAQPGQSLLRKSATWTPPNDCGAMSVPEMLTHIYKNRKGYAVAPNGHTCPFLSVEEWGRIADWIATLPAPMRGKARPISEYHEDMGPVLWWKFPIDEPPYCGTPNDLGQTVEVSVKAFGVDKMMRVLVGGWPGYHTHWTPIELPVAPDVGADADPIARPLDDRDLLIGMMNDATGSGT